MSDQLSRGESPNVELPFLQLIIVAAEAASLVAEYEKVTSRDELPQLLGNMLRENDLRIRAFPLPFPTVLVSGLIDLHAMGILYSEGFAKGNTISMVVNAQTGDVYSIDIPNVVGQFAPHLAAE